MASPQDTPAAIVRLATKADYEEVATLLTRAFANDSAMNWWGGVKKETALTNLNKLDAGMKKNNGKPPSSGGESEEQIIAVALWMTPGKTFDLSFSTLIKSGAFLVLMGWGYEGSSDFSVDFTPHVEESLHKLFKSRNLDRLDSCHLPEMAVDPEWEGKGQVDEAGHVAKGAEATGYPEWVMSKMDSYKIHAEER
ncbi:hypothetical protein EDD85DRAFT_791071 [Armillaria nabsnona]|nr:hypothetical protein EDD85DRAFT_791071 [Armillaria nabsnona]